MTSFVLTTAEMIRGPLWIVGICLRLKRATVYTLCPNKKRDYILYNNFNSKCPITIIFGTVSSTGKSMRHRKMVSFPTSPI